MVGMKAACRHCTAPAAEEEERAWEKRTVTDRHGMGDRHGRERGMGGRKSSS